MTDSQSGKQDEGLVERLTKVASLGKEDFHGLPLLTLAVTSVAAQAAARIEELEREVVRLAKDVEELSAPSAERTSELEAANVGLADEAARMRMALSELVDAGSAFDHRDDMDFDEEQAAEKRWLAALDAARPFTEAALLAPSATRPTPPAEAGKWIPVSERLPEMDTYVLVHNGKWTGLAKYVSDESALFDADERWQSETAEFIECLGTKVTHWMPLPAAPAEGEGGR